MNHKHIFTLTALAVLLLAGCAGISPEFYQNEAAGIKRSIAGWHDQPVEKFLKMYQEPKETMNLGGTKVRLTLHYTPTVNNYNGSRFYELYFYVSEEGKIYNTDLRRMSRSKDYDKNLDARWQYNISHNPSDKFSL